MKLYRNADGVWVGTQAEAGNKTVIEVPVDKPNLLEWLNANIRSMDDTAAQGQERAADPDGLRAGDTGVAQEAPSDNEPLRSDDAGGNVSELEHRVRRAPCPKCKLGYAGAERIANTMTVSALADKIMTLPGFAFSTLSQAVIDRMLELKHDTITQSNAPSDQAGGSGNDPL